MNSGFHTMGPSKGRCARCPVRATGVCSGFDEADVEALAEQSHHSIIAAGTPILEQDEACDRVGIILSGTAKVVFATSEGQEHLLQLLHPGQLIGDPLGAHNLVSWEAATDLTLCWLPYKALDALIDQHPGLYPGYLKAVHQQRELGQLWVAKLRGRSTIQRLAYWLVTQAQSNAIEDRALVTIELTRRDLASYLNMSSEALCRALQQLHDRKAIVKITPERLEIHDLAKLRVFAKCVDDRVLQTLSANAGIAARNNAQAAIPAQKMAFLQEPQAARTF